MSTPILSRDACRAYLDEATFKLRPADYGKRYPKWPGAVGLEIEMLPVYPEASPTELPRSVTLQGEKDSVAAILRGFAKERGHEVQLTEDDHGDPLLLCVYLEQEDNISFEPGGQVEFSSKPYPCLSDAVRRTREMQRQIEAALRPHGIEIVQVGINPWHTVPELGLQMKKARYRAMNEHFSRISEYGQRMMRQTCTVQVNLDFGPDESTLARRYLASMLLAPIATATFAYSPVVDRKASGARTFRSRIWRHADPSRTGLPGLDRLAAQLSRPTRDTCIDTYLDFVLGATVVFVTGQDYKVPDQPITFGEWIDHPERLGGLRPTLDDFKTHLTLMFPEVRPRGFLELRSIDCQPRAFQAVPAAYAVGLLYEPRTLDRLIELLLPRRDRMDELLRKSEGGLQDPELAGLAREVMALAAEGFSNLAPCFKAENGERELAVFRDHFTERGRTPADDLLDRMTKDRTAFPTRPALAALEDEWSRMIDSRP